MAHLKTLIGTLFLTMALFSTSFVHAKDEKVSKHEGIDITVNINNAGIEELETLLVGIGSSKAKAIVDYRNTNGKFVSIDDLSNVKGIGDRLLEKNRNRIEL
ncbi:ComEA family DNA-binding protein [Aliivibrio wodanis]|uniref:Transporter n=1 Tax=Aliivibrio wodanis TaxID=80852 RepID=A0A5Q4ZWQ4_9GAMM|nr:putative protein [Aliivibrio wodanis]